MNGVQRLALSVVGSVLASVAASWLLRRLLLATEQGGDGQGGKPSEVVVVVPIILGNQLTIGAPRRRNQDVEVR